jgi:hypothetical protein
MTGITKVFGDNSDTWRNNFGVGVVKLHLAFRCLILFTSMGFFGAMLILVSGDKFTAKKTYCESDVSSLPDVFIMR